MTEQNQQEDSFFTCQICIEPTPSSKKIENGGSLCTHPYCLDCISKYIEVQVQSMTPNILCPGLGCEHALDPLSCRPLVPEQVFVKWCDLLCESAVLGQLSQNQYSSYCPYQDCSALVLDECGNTTKKINCPNCKKKFCFLCKIPWHAGYRCTESGQLRDQNDILVGKLIERNKWTRCYNCGHSVERVGGCNIIHCKCGELKGWESREMEKNF
ncbi:hypothetical protein Tsubulata_051468, partial [Turnera subulata]